MTLRQKIFPLNDFTTFFSPKIPYLKSFVSELLSQGSIEKDDLSANVKSVSEYLAKTSILVLNQKEKTNN